MDQAEAFERKLQEGYERQQERDAERRVKELENAMLQILGLNVSLAQAQRIAHDVMFGPTQETDPE
jgi:hypothetical protein